MAKNTKIKETPLMKQYNTFKAKYPSSLLLFRVGDFYETFGQDAIVASKELDIVLTKRSNGSTAKVELAGFPYHALDTYLPKLIRAGHRVAICDQLEEPKQAKGIVKRGVTELVTPGLSYHDNVLRKSQNNYLASIHIQKEEVGIALLDLSTGEFFVAQGTMSYVENLMQNFNPAEVIFSKKYRNSFETFFSENYNTYCLDDWIYEYDFSYEKLIEHFETNSLKGFGIENLPFGIVAAGTILHYLRETEHKNIKHITSVSRIETEGYIWLDKFTIKSLELIYPQQESGVSLMEIIDETMTPMGARLLKRWIMLPLKDGNKIQERLDIVELFLKKELQENIIKHLNQVGDIERLIGKVAAKRINPRELVQLKKSIQHILPIRELLKTSGNSILQMIGDQIHPCEEILKKIDCEIEEEAPIITNQGKIIKKGVNQQLDELRQVAYSGKDYLTKIQEKEIEQTGISSLKISYNKVFGYYLEVTNRYKDKVPSNWIRKQTLANAERYITEELKVYENQILTAEEQIFQIEQQLFIKLVEAVLDYVNHIQNNAKMIAKIDCLSAFCLLAKKNNYAKPVFIEQNIIDIKQGRHPVIEKQLPTGEAYVPNDVYMDNETQQILLITGPNMAGKSALLRQTALIILMAQIGSFVPAEQATLGIVDKIFTRVGASDNIAKGESTFMVEMNETASILNNLSDRSLVLMDEIGRGTSTFDGISIAWAIIEYLHNHQKNRAKTLFATHYHELNQLSEELTRVKSFNVSVKQMGDKIILLRTLKKGGIEHSFGINVAQMSGIPKSIIERAKQILLYLEQNKQSDTSDVVKKIKVPDFQMSLFEQDPKSIAIQKFVTQLDVNTLSPIEALLKIKELKDMINN